MIHTLHKNIHIVENFINRSTASFLEKCFDENMNESANHGIFAGPGHASKDKNDFNPGTLSLILDGDQIYNTGIDILKLINSHAIKTISNFYKEQYVLRSIFYSRMTQGSENKMHIDNYYIDQDKNVVVRQGFENDKSSILYLNDNYSGGELYFPIQDFNLKPKPGTLIFFEGNINIPHSVKQVTGGLRNNIISFYGKEEDVDYSKDTYVEDYHPISEDMLEKIKEINSAE